MPFFLFCNLLSANQIVAQNENILNDKVVNKIEQIGNELYKKSGIFVGVCAYESLDGKTFFKKIDDLNISKPYIILILAKNEKKVDILSDKKSSLLFDKEQILSPFPSKGTILPILTSKKGKDIYNAAILNGYGDITEQVASSLNLQLKSGIGNSNKNTLNIIRFLVYGSIIFVLAVIFYRRKIVE